MQEENRPTDTEPGSSKPVKPIKHDTVDNRLKYFIELYRNRFKTKLDAYDKEAAVGGPEKTGKTVEGIVDVVEITGLPAGFVRRVINYFPKKLHKDKALVITAIFIDLTEDYIKKILEKTACDIFRCYESQFIQVKTSHHWRYAIERLAVDAVDRAINFLFNLYLQDITVENVTSDVLTACVISGTSKVKNILSMGYEVMNADEEKWRTTDLYTKVGIVRVSENGDCEKYYKKKNDDGSGLYGYRLPFEWEKRKWFLIIWSLIMKNVQNLQKCISIL